MHSEYSRRKIKKGPVENEGPHIVPPWSQKKDRTSLKQPTRKLGRSISCSARESLKRTLFPESVSFVRHGERRDAGKVCVSSARVVVINGHSDRQRPANGNATNADRLKSVYRRLLRIRDLQPHTQAGELKIEIARVSVSDVIVVVLNPDRARLIHLISSTSTSASRPP